MKILFYLGHPAHFHLFKNIISTLKSSGNEVLIAIKTKDVLENLLNSANYSYHNLLNTRRKNNKLSLITNELKKHQELYKYCKNHKPDLLVGTSSAMPLVGKILNIPFLNVGEDDAEVIPLYAKFTYPLSTEIITPDVCDNGKWNDKSVKYNGYHELAYLHPSCFKPDKKVAKQYLNPDESYFIIRFSKLDAHHDQGIGGINNSLARQLIEILKPHGTVYLTSERKLDPDFEKFRISINPLDIHHVMAFARLFIGDSQTMAAESGVLGVPFIRLNDFVDRIGYLKDLEVNYKLGFGIKPSNPDKLLHKTKELIETDNLDYIFQKRREVMLNEKIDVNSFFVWFISNYPESKKVVTNDPDYQQRFFK